jgi:uncharacterized protein YwqG
MAYGIRAALATAHHEALWPQVEKLIRPAILLSVTPCESPAAVPHAASRLGGHPDMPAGAAWPTRDDVPMEFVAQLRLADVAPHDPGGVLPKTGHLLFFFNTQWGVSDMDEDAKYECGKVLYFDCSDADLARVAPPRVEIEHESMGSTVAPRVYHGATVTFSSYPSLPAGISAFLAGDELAKVRDVWQDFVAKYGDVLPPYDDMPEGYHQDNHALGYFSDPDYVGAMAEGEVLLLQLDSDDRADFQWGDCDKLFFVASAERVAAKDFSQVRLHSVLG